ncbi:MAG TPA: hypothetical protein VKW78_12850 [Terriglobales bacterium]|nr:hypothetical protein [Terriglobales bacterium]
MTFTKKLGFALATLIATCFTAAAQDAAAKFTLTHEVSFQRTTLPAGTYLLSVYSRGATQAILRSEDGKGLSVIAVPTVADYSSTCKSNSVNLVRDGEAWAVESVCFNNSGLALYFNPTISKTDMARLSSQAGTISGSH